MTHTLRTYFPYVFPLLFVLAMLPVFQFSELPPADFTFTNGTEIESLDSAHVSGAPEGRIIDAMFEGLYRKLPDPDDPSKMLPVPAMATSYELSEDQRTYTFTIRQDAKWSDGSPVTAHDWVFSWQRFLHPETASKYSYQLWYLKNAQKYTGRKIEVGDRVEVERDDRSNPGQTYPRGTMLAGIVKSQEQLGEEDDPIYIYDVQLVAEQEGVPQWDQLAATERFVMIPRFDKRKHAEHVPHLVRQVLPHFSEVGVYAEDDHTLVVTLENPTPYFLELVSFYPLYPVNQACVEKHGYPEWTKTENVVNNGPYNMEFRRIRDRIRLRKNPEYWNAGEVKMEVIDALAVQSETTTLNMYMNGQVDWGTTVPTSIIPELIERDKEKRKQPGRENERPDMQIEPMLTVYFYRVNTTKPPLDNPLVRRALNLAIDKQEIVEFVTKAGQVPALGLVPPGMANYEQQTSGTFDPEEARRLLAEAGYPGGKGIPRIRLVYNTLDAHRDIAEVIQQQWKRHLQIDAELINQEWAMYLKRMQDLDFDLIRAGWIGDYPDPNTFLDMFVTDGENNQTGWSNAQYDQLIEDAMSESDEEKRMEMLAEAERILLEEMPILPIYFYVSQNIVRPYVKNFYPNLQDLHPLHIMEIDEAQRDFVLEAEGLR